jgi:thioredoxin-like negative regulator of GroEL
MVTASPEATTEDFFFLGVAYLYLIPPEAVKAIAPLIRAGADPSGELYDEARWHLALAYVETKQFAQAREILTERHQASTWNAERAAELLQKIPKQ